MDTEKSKAGKKLADYIASLEGFELLQSDGPVYMHMGAIIADATLQAGLNYKNVVFPRVENILKRYPEAKTTSAFSELIKSQGTKKIFNWDGDRKPRSAEALTELLHSLEIEKVEDLQSALLKEDFKEALLEIKGVGPKTVDYLKILVGIPAIAVDRHIYNFVAMARLESEGYDATRAIVEEAAKILKVDISTLDHSIWVYMSNSENA